MVKVSKDTKRALKHMPAGEKKKIMAAAYMLADQGCITWARYEAISRSVRAVPYSR